MYSRLTLTRGKKIVQAVPALKDNWGWFGSPAELRAVEDIPELRMTACELTEFATASCWPDLWAFRVWCDRRNIPVRTADWAWYNL